MRICLVAHGFPPEERTGVENYTAALAAEFVRAGHWVEVFAPTRSTRLGHLATRRELRPEGYGLTRIALHQGPRNPAETLDPQGVAARFGEWLDRERPDVVHFQHVIKLGLGLVEEAHRRAIPILYTAHDFYPVCHRYTLLRPDLAVCPDPEGAHACARCDLATAVLNAVPDIGDYQMGVPPGDLPDEAGARLAGVLDGDPVADGGFHPEEWDRACTDRAALDARRREVFGLVDLCIVPSRFMGVQMERSGMPRIEYLPYGIPTADLVPVAAEAPVGQGEPLRLAFIGGLSKHKGVDVLLEGFGHLMRARPGEATLDVWGYSSDSAYVARLARRAGEVGARWRGAYERPDLPALLADVDVVVVPSTWYENAPIAIREALAAGRPVVASRLGALGESVRDGVDGLLFEPGDPEALAEVLERLLDPEVVRTLAEGIEPMVTMETNANQLLARYDALVEATEERVAEEEGFDQLPESMVDFARAASNLERAPLRELFEFVAGSFGRLGAALEVDAADLRTDALLVRAFADGDEAQRNLRDSRHEVDWLRHSLADVEEARRSFGAYRRWSEETLADRDATIASLQAELAAAKERQEADAAKVSWLEGVAKDKETAAEAERERADWLKSALDTLEGEREAMIEERRALEEEATWLRGLRDEHEKEVAWLRGVKEELEQRSEWQAAEVAGRDAELAGRAAELEGRDAALAAHEAQIDRMSTELAECEERLLEKRRLREEAEQRWAGLVGQLVAPLRVEGVRPEVAQDAEAAGDQLAHAASLLAVLIEERRWRAAEMEAAVEEARRVSESWLAKHAWTKSGLGARFATWQAENEARARLREHRNGASERDGEAQP